MARIDPNAPRRGLARARRFVKLSRLNRSFSASGDRAGLLLADGVHATPPEAGRDTARRWRDTADIFGYWPFLGWRHRTGESLS
jgi:hypothetical protein